MVKGATRNTRQRTDGVYTDYPENWPAIAKATKDAAEWRCVRCRHPHEGPWKQSQNRGGDLQPAQCDLACQHDNDAKQRVLTVHHLDLNKANVAWWNLAALCQVCHLSVQSRVDFHQYYMLKQTHWIETYIHGWTIWQLTGLTAVNVRLSPFDFYLGRPSKTLAREHPDKDLANVWMNPFRISKAMSRAESIGRYTEYIVERIAIDPEKYDLRQLMNGDGGCCCKPEPCHVDVLAEMLLDLMLKTLRRTSP